MVQSISLSRYYFGFLAFTAAASLAILTLIFRRTIASYLPHPTFSLDGKTIIFDKSSSSSPKITQSYLKELHQQNLKWIKQRYYETPNDTTIPLSTGEELSKNTKSYYCTFSQPIKNIFSLEEPTHIKVLRMDSLAAAYAYVATCQTVVLNFANPSVPGGGM
ncbi:MAG: poly(ADP-ribose) glycohydrolase domain-containing protein, partial [Rhabdochlamydiaceae bacterium]